MKFKIVSSTGKPVEINTLDEQIAQFWGKEISMRSYATPFPEELERAASRKEQFLMQSSNWFDCIGWAIARGCSSWDDVRNYIYHNVFEEEINFISLSMLRAVSYLQGRGYQPLPC